MPQPPNTCDTPPSKPSLTIDWEVYAAMLEESDLSQEQQKELIETLWPIMVAFVDLGFDLNPVAQICGEAENDLADDTPDVVSLIEENLKQNPKAKEDTWQN